MFIEYVAFIDDEIGPGNYITKTRVIQDSHIEPSVKFSLTTYSDQALKFGMKPCMVVPDIFRDPACDVIVYCRPLHLEENRSPINVCMGFKQEFYVYYIESAKSRQLTKCPFIWFWNVLTWHFRVPDIMEPHLKIGWMSEQVKSWLDTLIRDLSVMHIPVTGYRALDIPGKIRLGISNVDVDTACHRLAMVRYILLRKQIPGRIHVSLSESLDPSDMTRDRSAGCAISVAIDSESIPNILDTTVCDCPDRFDSVFGVNRCETLVTGGPWWSYTVGLNTIGKSVNVKTNRITGEVSYMVDIRPGSQVNPYKYTAWLIPQIPISNNETVSQKLTEPVSLVLAQEQSVNPQTSIPSVPENIELYKDESENETDSDGAEIDGLTIISRHESEPEHRLASLARIKRRHKQKKGLSQWIPKFW